MKGVKLSSYIGYTTPCRRLRLVFHNNPLLRCRWQKRKEKICSLTSFISLKYCFTFLSYALLYESSAFPVVYVSEFKTSICYLKEGVN